MSSHLSDFSVPISNSDAIDIIDIAVTETVKAFIHNPWQFHGDTGIMQYLYHQMMSTANGRFYYRPRCALRDSLLLQSEHYTQLKYRRTGTEDGGGRFDFAIVNPSCIDQDGRIKKDAQATIAVEVGRNKKMDSRDDILAPNTATGVRPGDAVKIIRGLRYEGTGVGYVLGFYTQDQARRASGFFYGVKNICEELKLEGIRLLAVVATQKEDQGYVTAYPDSWSARLGGEWPAVGPIGDHARKENRIEASDFMDRCGPCNAAIQNHLSRALSGFQPPPRILYGGKTMTVSWPKRRLFRITNKHYGPERIREMHSQLRSAFLDEGILILDSNEVSIPEHEDAEFLDRFLRAMTRCARQVLLQTD